MNTAQQVLAERQAQIRSRLGDLAYERYRLMQRVEEIDRRILALEGAGEVSTQAQNAVTAQIAVEQAEARAKAEAEAKAEADASNKPAEATSPAEEAPNA